MKALRTLCYALLATCLSGTAYAPAQALPPAVPAATQAPALAWQALDGPPGAITQLAVDPTNSLRLYAAAAARVKRTEDQTQWLSMGRPVTGAALYASQDGGSAWRPLTNNLPPGALTALYLDPATRTLFAGVEAAGLQRSSDDGKTWSSVSLSDQPLTVWQIARSAGGRYLYAAASDANSRPVSYLYRSGDDGQTWDGLDIQHGTAPEDRIAEIVTGAQGDELVLGTLTFGGEVWRSPDAGATWQRARVCESPSAMPDSVRTVVARLPEGEDGFLAACSRRVPGAEPTVLARSTDGESWTPMTAAGLPQHATVLGLMGLPGSVWLLATTGGAYRSTDGGQTWRLLEGVLSSGGVAAFRSVPGSRTGVLAATGYGVFTSHDGGALWQPINNGLPANSTVAAVLTHPDQPSLVYAFPGESPGVPPPILSSTNGGQTWTPDWRGLPAARFTAWAQHPKDPKVLFVGTVEGTWRTVDGGLTWQPADTGGDVTALAIAPSATSIIYAWVNRRPDGTAAALRRSTDAGTTWQTVTAAAGSPDQPSGRVVGLVVDPAAAEHLWLAIDNTGIFESLDAGTTWRGRGLAGKPLRWLVAGSGSPIRLYAGSADGGIYRWDGAGEGGIWSTVTSGLPANSIVTALLPDPRATGTLWAARDGGGVYRTTDGGDTWSNVAAGMGDNLVQAMAIDYSTNGAVFAGTATAGLWSLRAGGQARAEPAAVDARVEIVWPHGNQPVAGAAQANIGLRLFMPGSLVPPPCGWSPKVSVWQALDTEPAAPLDRAAQRTVDGRPFPYWELNDADVRAANDPQHKLYYMVAVGGVKTATSIWAHASDPRTYFPLQDVPSGIATDGLEALDARIEIVWPHDAAGNAREVSGATLANVAVALFRHGTRLSVPVAWAPTGITLYGAWNQDIGQPLAQKPVRQIRQSGAISYPVWEFDNIPVGRATNATNKLYLWVMVDGAETYPTIWTHGADARTVFPAMDEPVEGCAP